jgi:type II secretion system protein G
MQRLNLDIKEYRNSLKKGFSIIEITIVIGIIAILAAAAFGGFRLIDRVKRGNTVNKLASLDAALETYDQQIGEYPQELKELIEGPASSKLAIKFEGALIQESDLKDGWGNEFVYEKLSGKNGKYQLYAIDPKGHKIYSKVTQERGI